MIIGEKLRTLREHRNLSQGDIERRTGLLRCYISRVENGHSIPTIETLEKMARAVEVPTYVLFYDNDDPQVTHPKSRLAANGWGESGRDAQTLDRFRRLLSHVNEADINLLLFIAQKMAYKRKVKKKELRQRSITLKQ